MEITVKGQQELHKEVTQTPLCTGCGACVNLCAHHAACEDQIIRLHDCDMAEGRCYAYCPRTPTDVESLRKLLFNAEDLTPEVGAVKGFYIARAADESQRAGAQHGGTVTALMTLAMKEGIIDSAIIADKNPDLLPRGITINFPDVIGEKGKTRFAVSPNIAEFNALTWVGGRKIGIVATPCQALALAKMRAKPVATHAARIDQLKLVVGLFCGWALSWDKLSAVIRGRGIDPESVEGMDVLPSQYQILQVYTTKGTVPIPLGEIDPDCIRAACHYCPDMTAEFSDISVGSARLPEGWDAAKRWNQVIVRTSLGERLMALACEKGILEFRDVPQGNLDRLMIASLGKRRKAAVNLSAEARKSAAGGSGHPDMLRAGRRVVSVSADKDFMQQVIPSVIKAVLRRDDMTLVVGSLRSAGCEEPSGDIAQACEAVGAKVEIQDAFDTEGMRHALSRMTKSAGLNVLVLRQSFILDPQKKAEKEYTISISETLCLGEQCGCNRLCTRVFHCPGLVWDNAGKKPRIVDDICTGCGACSLVCTTGAIIRKKAEY